MSDAEDVDIPDTDVLFVHARPFPGGYAIDVVDASQGTNHQFAVTWDFLPEANNNWTAHDFVEYFITQTLPAIAEAAGDRDFVMYVDCLKIGCPAPHLYTRRALEQAGAL